MMKSARVVIWTIGLTIWFCHYAFAQGPGDIVTVAGDGFSDDQSNGRYGGDGGPALLASFNRPTRVVLDEAGNMVYCGSGTDFSGDGGPATAASLNHPRDGVFDAAGNMYIADADDFPEMEDPLHRPATQALLSQPQGLTLDNDGNLIIFDSSNDRVRKVVGGHYDYRRRWAGHR